MQSLQNITSERLNTSFSRIDDQIQDTDDWISCFLEDPPLAEGICRSGYGFTDGQTPASIQNPLYIPDQNFHTAPPTVAAPSSSSLSIPSFLANSSDQDMWEGQDFDAELFLDDSFPKEYFEEIASSKFTEENLQTLSQLKVDQCIAESTEDFLIESEVIKEQELPNSDVISGKVSETALQIERAEITAKVKCSRKRKSPENSDYLQSDWNDAERSNESRDMTVDDEKRQVRLMRNRESAQLSRQRKKMYVDELQEKLRTMASTIAELNNTIGLISAENVNLRMELAYFIQAHGPVAKPGISPFTYPAYVGARPPFSGLHAPPVPIPRLKSQAPLKCSKKLKASAASYGRSKSFVEGKTKKLIGAATMGLCLVMVVLATLGSNKLAKESTGRELSMNTGRNRGIRIGGRVLMSTNQAESPRSTLKPNTSWSASIGNMMRQKWQLNLGDQSLSVGEGVGIRMKGLETTHMAAMDCYTLIRGTENGSASCFVGDIFQHSMTDPLAASLFITKNDKLVRIDGSLIIQAIAAGDKAAQQSMKEDSKRRHSVEPGIVHKRAGPGVPVGLLALEHEGSKQKDVLFLEHQKVLTSNQHIHLDAARFPYTEPYGSMQQWLMSDFTDTILSTGTCTEVFQFETSPVPEMNEANEVRSSEERSVSRKMSYQSNLARTHKILGSSFPLPPIRHPTLGKNAPYKEKLTHPTQMSYKNHGRTHERPCPASIVVSVLSEPNVAGDDGRQTPGGSKGISNIFVVVLLDCVKYVTYSCMLPSNGPKPQLVTT